MPPPYLTSAWPEHLWGWITLALMLPGLLVVFALMIVALLRRQTPRGASPDPAEPAYYRVLGVDAVTGEKRETLIRAGTRAGAEGRAGLEGIVVTDIQPVQDTQPAGDQSRDAAT